MSYICRRLFVGKPVTFQKELDSWTSFSTFLCVVLEEIEQVLIFEVFLKVLLRVFASTVNRGEAHSFLVDLASVNFLFDCAHSDEAVNDDIFFLANSERTVDSLIIIGWIPVGVKDDSSISTCQVKSKTSNFGG